MKVTNLRKGLIHIFYKNNRELAKNILRFQEHYESPNQEFVDRPFTLGEYREWYRKKFNAFTYYDDWDGFNIPGYIFNDFKDGLFDPLTKGEQNILETIKGRRNNFYVIATSSNSHLNTMDHEICHALWYLEPTYKRATIRLINKYRNELSSLFKFLKDNGYNDQVLLDEAHAYSSADYEWLKKKNIQVPELLHNELRNILKGFKYGINKNNIL